jgi:NADH:ubiquinone oxidoreductase subunit C
MRKDFPLIGYIELRYNENKKRIVSDRVQLAQEYRIFSFETPW